MTRKYYTLCERTPGQLFSPEFGSWIKAEVVQERADLKESGSFVKGTEFAIIETTNSQRAISHAVEELNTPAIRAKALKEKGVVSTVIVAKLPNSQVRKNLAKLERGRSETRGPDTDRTKTIKAIYKDEGASACLGLCSNFKMTKREMLLLLATFE